jgi:hypothetical protein
MPRKTSNAPATATEEARARIAAGLTGARARTGLSEQQVVDLLGQQGVAISARSLRSWESSGLLHFDSAVSLADAYGTTMDVLAGRRAFRQRHPSAELPPRSSW